MDIRSFIKPKNEVVYLFDDYTLKTALEEMEKYCYTSIPIINREGNYVGTITEGDFLRYILQNEKFNLKDASKVSLASITRHRDYCTIHVDSTMDQLIVKAADQNFVPIIDDKQQFVGIVTRKTILNYFFNHQFIVL